MNNFRYMQPDLVDGELYLAPNFPAPPNTDYQGYHNYIDEMMPPVIWRRNFASQDFAS